MATGIGAVDDSLLGHPRGVYVLALTEMWERFSYYGMRALLVFFMTDRFAFSDSRSFTVYGSYTALIYVSPLIGGLLADRYLGAAKAVTWGAVLMILGHLGLAAEDAPFTVAGPMRLQVFYASLAFLVVGVGLLKPNVSTMVGGLYPREGASRDAGFTLFVCGVTFGASLSAITCGYLGQTYGWAYGFGLAACGMLLGLVTFKTGQKHLRHVGRPPDPPAPGALIRPRISREAASIVCVIASVVAVWPMLQMFDVLGYVVGSSFAAAAGGLLLFGAFRLERQQRRQLIAMLLLMSIWICFAALVEQAGSSINLFTERVIDRQVGASVIRSAQLQGLLPLLNLCFAPLFIGLWRHLDARGIDMPTPMKFALSLVFLSLGYTCLWIGALVPDQAGRVHLAWLAVLYACFALGDLLILPVGLSAITRLAPAKVLGLVMALWMLANGIGNYLAALIARSSALPPSITLDPIATLAHGRAFFGALALLALVLALLALAIAPLTQRLMHEVHR
jgi:POT family proton-dependent oligopeptide transporter